MLRSGSNTPVEATVAETERQRGQTQDSPPEGDTVAEMGRKRVHILDRPQLNASNLLEEDDPSTTTARASSTGAVVSSAGAGIPPPSTKVSSSDTETPSPETGTPPQEAGVSSS